MLLRDLQGKSRRRGIVVVFVALTLIVIVGLVAIVVDGGMLQDRRRHVQAAADAAAYAAAAELFLQDPTSNGLDVKQDARNSARAIAAANGYIDDNTASANSKVTINVPPISGRFAGRRNHAEVIIEYQLPRYFSGVLGSGSLPIRARAVARGAWAPWNDGILVLDADDRASLKVNGGGTNDVDAIMVGADVIVNSRDAAALEVVGSASITSATGFNITGGYSTSGGGAMSGDVVTGVPPTPDPLRYLPPPDPDELTLQSANPTHISGNRIVTLSPGVYRGGLTISGQATVVLEPGIYYFDGGGINFSGQGSLIGTGVMLYNAPQNSTSSVGIDLTGGGSVSLSPMTTGLYQGMVLWQDRNSDVPLRIVGNANLNIMGTVYAANAPVSIDGNGAVSVGSQYISRTLEIGGNGAVNINYDPAIPPKRRIYMLVE